MIEICVTGVSLRIVFSLAPWIIVTTDINLIVANILSNFPATTTISFSQYVLPFNTRISPAKSIFPIGFRPSTGPSLSLLIIFFPPNVIPHVRHLLIHRSPGSHYSYFTLHRLGHRCILDRDLRRTIILCIRGVG